MHFGENQLSPSLIGLSPLSTGHPKAFQRLPVRSSSGSYPTFNLPMDRSPGFGSAATDYIALFRLAFASDPSLELTSPVTTTRRLIMQKAVRHPVIRHKAPNDCRQAVSGSISLPSLGFFSPFPHGTCALSVWQEYLALEGGPPIFAQDNTCPELLSRTLLSPTNKFSGTGLSPSLAYLSR